MPSAPQPIAATTEPLHRPPDHNYAHDRAAHTRSTPVQPQPAPEVVTATSQSRWDKVGQQHNTGTHASSHHALARRFLGPIPESEVNSATSEASRRRLRDVRRRAIRALRRDLEEDEGGEGRDGDEREEREGMRARWEARRAGTFGIGERGRVRGAVRRIKIRHAATGQDYEFEDDEEDEEEEEESGGWLSGKSRKKKKKRKDVWIGESFDIGREFHMPPPILQADSSSSRDRLDDEPVLLVDSPAPASVVEEDPFDTSDHRSITRSGSNLGDGARLSPGPSGEGGSSRRPDISSRSTQETFVTARTEMGSATSSKVHLPSTSPASIPYSVGAASDLQLPEADVRRSITSSLRPLVDPSSAAQGASPVIPGEHGQSQADSSKGNGAPITSDDLAVPRKGFAKRLKSALRKDAARGSSSAATVHVPNPNSLTDLSGTDQVSKRTRGAKTVQFPVDLVQLDSNDPDTPRKGNKRPADPGEVLSRHGSLAEGTSAGAMDTEQERDQAEAEEEYEDFVAGDVIMRDRMLVRVAHHRQENIALFDEATQRRSPCDRVEPLEEYIVAWRRGYIEFYQDHQLPLKERFHQGQKKLCFVAPLDARRSTLSIFNYTDMTIALTTSAGKLSERFNDFNTVRASTTRSKALKDRVKQSRQAKWLASGRRGTHIFIMKLAERSRAVDWFWELWREMGGQLPTRIDVVLPTFSTSVRLLVPEGEEGSEVGSREICRAMSASKTVKEIWDLLGQSIDREELARQRGHEINLVLAWKGTDGSLDWLAWDTTVRGFRRDRQLLASVAVSQGERKPHSLQLRNATHQPQHIVLEDGTQLDEPPGIEGFLTRHKTSSAGQEEVYLCSHDGNIFVCSPKSARPPIQPRKEASTPAELFPEVYKTFADGERRRAADVIRRSTGCVDVRDIERVEMCISDEEVQSENGKRHRKERCFEIVLRFGSSSSNHPNGKGQGGLDEGGSVRFEAKSRSIAQEWVTHLTLLSRFWTRRHRVDARVRMDTVAAHQGGNDLFSGSELANSSDAVIGQVWDWCVVKGCRPVTLSGRLFVKEGRLNSFRSAFIVLTGGSLVVFRVKTTAFHRRSSRFPLFGAYVYSGMLAHDDVRETVHEAAFAPSARVYQDGLQSTDGAEDTTFAVRISWTKGSWYRESKAQPWERDPEDEISPPPLSKEPVTLLTCRARSKLERDRWVWAINAEMERMVRAHTRHEDMLRNAGTIPKK